MPFSMKKNKNYEFIFAKSYEGLYIHCILKLKKKHNGVVGMVMEDRRKKH